MITKTLGAASVVAGAIVLVGAYAMASPVWLAGFWILETLWVLYYSMRCNTPRIRGVPFYSYVVGSVVLVIVATSDFGKIPWFVFGGASVLCVAMFTVMLGSLWRR